MPNPLFQQLNNQPKNNGLIQQFEQFKRTIQGDPKSIVQGLLNSGRMTPQQLDQYQQMAMQFRQMLK